MGCIVGARKAICILSKSSFINIGSNIIYYSGYRTEFDKFQNSFRVLDVTTMHLVKLV